MKFYCLIFLIIWFCCPKIYAQEIRALGARSAGLANTSGTIVDAYSSFNNIAGTSSLKGIHVASTIENRFGLKSLSTIGFASTYATQYGVHSISFTKYGDRYFSEQTVGLGIAHSLDRVLLGLKFNYHQLSIEESMTRRNILADFGGIVNFSESFIFAARVSNFGLFKLSSEQYHVPVILNSGISYRPSKNLMINMEAEKNI